MLGFTVYFLEENSFLEQNKKPFILLVVTFVLVCFRKKTSISHSTGYNQVTNARHQVFYITKAKCDTESLVQFQFDTTARWYQNKLCKCEESCDFIFNWFHLIELVYRPFSQQNALGEPSTIDIWKCGHEKVQLRVLIATWRVDLSIVRLSIACYLVLWLLH